MTYKVYKVEPIDNFKHNTIYIIAQGMAEVGRYVERERPFLDVKRIEYIVDADLIEDKDDGR